MTNWIFLLRQAAGLAALCLLVPGLAALLLGTGRRSQGLFGVAALVAGFAWAVLSAWLILKWRQQLRRRRTGRADDWICAACLHSEAST